MARHLEPWVSAFATFLLGCLVPSVGAAQHITIDGSLSAAQTLIGPNYTIGANLGKQVGGNLFQSFGIFGLNQGENATFSGPSTVTNVIGRVTGGTASSINGAINSGIAGANLFLINPSGIVFGPNATVNVAGSFHAATADYIRLSDGAKFQATNPSGSTLSAAPPAAFGFLTATPPAITVNGTALAVPSGQTLGLVGGPVSIAAANGSPASLSAPTGTIYVTSAAGTGEVPVNPQNTSAQTATNFGPVSVNGGPVISVGDPTNKGSGGSVFVTAGALTMDGTPPGGVASANATSPASTVFTLNANNYGAGPGGNVTVNAGTLSLTNGAGISSNTLASGNAGTVSVSVAGPLSIDGAFSSLEHSGIFSSAYFGSTGNAGQVTVNAGSLSVTDGGRIGANTLGSVSVGGITYPGATGAAGTVSVTVPGQLSVSGISPVDLTPSEIASVSRLASPGASGQVTVNAGSLSITNQGQISTSTTGNGNAGNLTVDVAGQLAIDGGGIPAVTGITGITSAQQSSSAASLGNAGQVTVNAGTVSLTSGGIISTSTSGLGNAGSVSIAVGGALSIDSMNSGVQTGIASLANSRSTGNGGAVSVSASQLSISNGGAAISSSTSGPGNGGNVSVTAAGALTIDGSNSNLSTGIGSQSFGGTGNAGAVAVSAGSLSIGGGAAGISSSTLGSGNGGTVAVAVAGALTIDGSNLTLPTEISAAATGAQSGAGGSVSVQAASLTLQNGGQIATSSAGQGSGGDINVTVASDIVLAGAGSLITARSTGSGNAGSITLSAANLQMSNQAATSTEAATANGGNIALSVSDLLYLQEGSITTSSEGVKSNGGNIAIGSHFVVLTDQSSITANAFGGNGGNIIINAGAFIPSADSAVTASSQTGIAGMIAISGQETDLNGTLVVLPSALRAAAAILRDSCAARSALPRSTLTEAGRGGLPQDPEATIPAVYLAGRAAEPSSPAAAAAAAAPTLIPGRNSLRLAKNCGD